MSKNKVYLSIIVPCFNEDKTVDIVLSRLVKLNIKKNFEIIIVNDGSTDNTDNKITKFLKKYKGKIKITYLKHESNKGKGAAIHTALKNVCGTYVLIQDADLEYNINNIPKLFNIALRDKVAIVFGSRNMNKCKKYIYKRYYWGGVFITKLFNFIYKTRLTDITTGYKLILKEQIIKLNLSEKGFNFCMELSCKAVKSGLSIIETSISYKPRSFAEGKKINFVDGLYAVCYILKCKILR